MTDARPPGEPAWRSYGRLLVELLALEASRGPAAGATLASDDVRRLLGRAELAPGPAPADVRAAYEQPLTAAWDALVDGLDAASGLGLVAATAGLADEDVAVLALLGAVELDPDLGALCAVASGRTVDHLTVGLVARALGPAGRDTLAPDAPLRRAALVDVDADAPLAAARVRLPRAVAWALAGVPSPDPGLALDTEVRAAPEGERAVSRRVLTDGPDRTRRRQAAVAALDAPGALVGPPPVDERGWAALVRHATVTGLGVVLDLPAPDALDAAGRRWVARADHLAWALAAPEPVAVGVLTAERWTDVRPAAAGATDAEWAAVFGDAPPPARGIEADPLRLAARVRRTGDDPAVTLRRLASGAVGAGARVVEPRAGWDALILPDALTTQLHDLVGRYRQRRRVHEEWGLPLFPSPGVVALFSGPSGTGKTTAAEILAHELGIGMYRVDLSAVVSKYVGETEKNLEAVFGAAHAGDHLLLFDEADSLFGARSAVTDARDRYANMEVSYLLQRLETYDGVVVLTTNFPGNMDAAFLRRIHVSLHFPVPGAEDRRRMWERALARAPREGLDLEQVASRYDLTGGSIRNAALTAAFLAAAADRPVGPDHVQRAVVQEMTKLGRRPPDERPAVRR